VRTVSIHLPEDVISALGKPADELAHDVRIAAAVYWYALGKLSQERAAEAAGLNRGGFITALGRARVNVFQTDYEDFIGGEAD
jgi:hypothetical protein